MQTINLAGKNVLITGGTRGIGRTISRTLAQAGARIGAIYRSDSETAARTLAELNSLPNHLAHFTLQADITEEAAATEAVRLAGERFEGALDFLILDAAAGAGGPLSGMTTENWKRPFEVNVHLTGSSGTRHFSFGYHKQEDAKRVQSENDHN